MSGEAEDERDEALDAGHRHEPAAEREADDDHRPASAEAVDPAPDRQERDRADERADEVANESAERVSPSSAIIGSTNTATPIV